MIFALFFLGKDIFVIDRGSYSEDCTFMLDNSSSVLFCCEGRQLFRPCTLSPDDSSSSSSEELPPNPPERVIRGS